MKKFVCSVCGYVYEGDAAPEKCPQCGSYMIYRKGKNGASYGLRSGLCLETQHFPDAIHHPEWPSCILKAGDTFESYTTFAFSAE